MAKLTPEGKRYVDTLWGRGDYLTDGEIAKRIHGLTGYKPGANEITIYRLTRNEPLLRPGERLGCIGNVFYYTRRFLAFLSTGRLRVQPTSLEAFRRIEEGHAEEEY